MLTSLLCKDCLFENIRDCFVRDVLKLPHSIKSGVKKQTKPVLIKMCDSSISSDSTEYLPEECLLVSLLPRRCCQRWVLSLPWPDCFGKILPTIPFRDILCFESGIILLHLWKGTGLACCIKPGFTECRCFKK